MQRLVKMKRTRMGREMTAKSKKPQTRQEGKIAVVAKKCYKLGK